VVTVILLSAHKHCTQAALCYVLVSDHFNEYKCMSTASGNNIPKLV